MEWILRLATHQDIPALHELIPHSVHQLQKDYYSLELREGALGSVFGVDSQLIKDSTYFVVENNTGIIGCGGWSYRKLLYGSDQLHTIDEYSLLDPKYDAARVRAFFVDPNHARKGIGTATLRACEEAIVASGYTRAELVATLTGEHFYASHGYVAVEQYNIELKNGLVLPVVRMLKSFTM
ncbi:N-acetyltransferase [Dulcicalothrix desertica PCC 7102]|uniref:N-acetyltransferase n=1 Tax=Dulcicalothrix desertica PCC 7102 TaxID=232991 RepID=A0A433VUW7_9CYAN|nr:GNAT family N-acetyltransferase [Dulcicalothrix desertica]RUT09875.1 N-acetyltransferase [Dulcicalothrix desertica PCC 7102]TWH51059.1 N-acetylglutamate synthase-like GNAT family acetyltransferase [Dulcicalothrix desertica PCC 7102]